jgi:hypothetical protein
MNDIQLINTPIRMGKSKFTSPSAIFGLPQIADLVMVPEIDFPSHRVTVTFPGAEAAADG